MHRVPLSAGGWLVTEQVRTVSAERLRRDAPDLTPTAEEIRQVRHVLGHMLM